ncbi:hypothetical protein C8Q79DRAFT_1120001 [Trametes meyenii]|nr:hypothetical protein C8Q79DRAFT_1120001 [Trametes meyenii]
MIYRNATILSHEDFLQEFVPEPKVPTPADSSKIFAIVPAQAQGTKLYEFLGDVINNTPVCPGFTFVSTRSERKTSYSSTHAIVDYGVYRTDRVPQSVLDEEGQPNPPFTNWSTIELGIVCKTHSSFRDPFEKDPSPSNPETMLRKKIFGQVLSEYAQFVFTHQHRTCYFMVLFLDDQCRIFRLDRSGIFATVRFNYKSNGKPLVEFLWRFAHLSPAERGVDITAEEVALDSELAKLMSDRASLESGLDDHARGRFAASLEPPWPWYLLHLTDERTGQKRRFLVGQPQFTAFELMGRGTRSYVALDADNTSGPFVHLKDTWRIVHDDIDKEGAVLEQLNKRSVPFIPTLLYHGDLGQSQHTLSVELCRKYYPDAPTEQMYPVKQHTHYRLVVKEVGKPLSEFKDGRELVFALFCCLRAHAKAYKAGFIHCDISFSNILLFPHKGASVGLLNDWELSKKVNSKHSQGLQSDRRGTWQFLSANVLLKPTKHIVVQDELESFFHVALYAALRFLPHNCLDADVGRLLHDYFDAYQMTQKGYTCGQMKLASMQCGQISFIKGDQLTEIRFFASPGSPEEHPLNALLGELLTWFKAYYAELRLHGGRSHVEEGSTPTGSDVPPSELLEELLSSDSERSDDEDNDIDSEDNEQYPSAMTLSQGLAEVTAYRKTLEGLVMRRQRKLSRKLRNHSAMLSLLKAALKKREMWSGGDKGNDKLPEKEYNTDSYLDPFWVTMRSSIVQSILGKREAELSSGIPDLDSPQSTPRKRVKLSSD